jgi:PAS domain S-box-containing protein
VDNSGKKITERLRETPSSDKYLRDIVAREERFRMLAEGAPVILWMTGPDGRSTVFNRRWADFIGAPHDRPVSGVAWYEALYPEDRQNAVEEFRRAFAEH